MIFPVREENSLCERKLLAREKARERARLIMLLRYAWKKKKANPFHLSIVKKQIMIGAYVGTFTTSTPMLLNFHEQLFSYPYFFH